MEPKQLTCMDEELHIEIVKPKEGVDDLVVSVSITRTYLISDPLEITSKNSDHLGAYKSASLALSCVI